MKEYLKQFYTEGFATTFYIKPIRYLEGKIKNKVVLKMINILIIILYTLFMIWIAVYAFKDRYPL